VNGWYEKTPPVFSPAYLLCQPLPSKLQSGQVSWFAIRHPKSLRSQLVLVPP
jgi:hypothetical protein